MTKIKFYKPIDPFEGRKRLIDELKDCLRSADYNRFYFAVAFAKSGPLQRLKKDLKKWQSKGNSIEAIFGVNHKGTSLQALETALDLFDKSYINFPNSFTTFHPKFYLFEGDDKAVCFYGSQNLTVGGTETNLEGGVKVMFDTADDKQELKEAKSCWTSLLPSVCKFTYPLNKTLIKKLVAEDLIFDERKTKPYKKKSSGAAPKFKSLFSSVQPVPPSALPKPPKSVLPKPPKPKSAKKKRISKKTRKKPSSLLAQSLLIQINFLPNKAEALLSVVALNQNPAFFKYPFKGKTKPKKQKNPAYPKRDPDPIVNITVFDNQGNVTHKKNNSKIQMSYYERKSELRIIVGTNIGQRVVDYSLLHLRLGSGGLDYYFDFYNPGSVTYQNYLAVCNQNLPSGGSKVTRKMAWL